MKTEKVGWDTHICIGCAYKKHGKCVIAKKQIEVLDKCPEHYTYELCSESSTEIGRRMNGLPHGSIFSKVW